MPGGSIDDDPALAEFRAALVRRFANLCPGCRVVFETGVDRSVAFHLVDASGQRRSNVIRLFDPGPRVLDTARLMRAVRLEGAPPAGLPDGF